MSEARSRWPVYEQKLYAVIHALKQWEHYLLHQDFVPCSDHVLHYIQSQKSLNKKHARWVVFLKKIQLCHTTQIGATKQGGWCFKTTCTPLNNSSNQNYMFWNFKRWLCGWCWFFNFVKLVCLGTTSRRILLVAWILIQSQYSV